MNRSIFQISFIHKRLLAFLGNSGTLLGLTALAALLITNAGGKEWYQHLVHLPMTIQVGDLLLEKSLQHWINDGLMAVFFLLIGLELKREFLRGYLASLDRVRIPVIAAIGGMLVPALIFLGINGGDDLLTRGWAIPTATDIAFSLGLLMALGSRVPVGLKVFLLALAILDDLGAVLIIALYYTSDLSGQAILNAGLCLAALALLNALQVKRALPYLLIGIPLWYFTLQSGVHATVAGVLLAAAIPSGSRKGPHKLIEDIEHNLHPLVSYLIIPIFAFFNAGIYVMEISFTDLSSPLTLGILLGLLVGKPIGICLFSAIALRLRLGILPDHVRWPHLFGMSLLCGIGFTMSLFVSALAYTGNLPLQEAAKLGILLGSLLSAIVGILVLALTLPAHIEQDAHT